MPYDADFRRLAVVLVTTSSRPLNQVAGELAMPPSTLRRWVRKATESATLEPTTDTKSAMRARVDPSSIDTSADILTCTNEPTSGSTPAAFDGAEGTEGGPVGTGSAGQRPARRETQPTTSAGAAVDPASWAAGPVERTIYGRYRLSTGHCSAALLFTSRPSAEAAAGPQANVDSRRSGGSSATLDPMHSQVAYSPSHNLRRPPKISPVQGMSNPLPPGRIPSLWRRLRPSHLPSVVVVTGWVVSVLLSRTAQLSGTGHDLALAVHLLSLVTAFGATVMVDWHGLLWLSGRRELRETLRVADAGRPLIWIGYAGLLISGTLLGPDLEQWRTWVKLGCVLFIGLNGAVVDTVGKQLAQGPPGARFIHVPVWLRRRMLSTAVLSAGCWWVAGVIGVLTSMGH